MNPHEGTPVRVGKHTMLLVTPDMIEERLARRRWWVRLWAWLKSLAGRW